MHKLTPRGGVLFDHRQRVGAASGAEIFRRVQPSSRAALRGLFSYECAIHRTGKRSTTALALVRSTALGGLALGRRSARSLRHCGQRLRKTTAVRLLAAAGTAMWTSTRITDTPSRQDCTCQKERVSCPQCEFIPMSFESLPSAWCCPSVVSWSVDPRSGGGPRHALPHAAQLGPRPAACAVNDGCQSDP